MNQSNNSIATALYRTIWRWHFYAGLFVIPFILFLSLTGAIYLFKPQIDAWEERRWTAGKTQSRDAFVWADEQVARALAAHRGATVTAYRLPRAAGEPAVVRVNLPAGSGSREVFVSATGQVLHSQDPERRITALVSDLHGSLLAGKPGSLLVELAGSWAIVMILSGLYLWWPKGAGAKWRLAGIVWPRLGLGQRALWRDLHAVTGFWVAGLALVLLLTALPWTDVWAQGFRAVRAEMGWTDHQPQDWKGGAAPRSAGAALVPRATAHEGHDHGEATAHSAATPAAAPSGELRWADAVLLAEAEALPFPALVLPPHAPVRHGAPPGDKWLLSSEAQNRPAIRKLWLDPESGEVVRRQGFADRHPIDKAITVGIAWHEGQLFGLPNQLIGLATAIALMLMAVSGFVLWRRRKPTGKLGAPPIPKSSAQLKMVTAIVVLVALLLPVLGASLLLLWLFDRLLLPRLPRLARWLGAETVSSATN
jgi:uncharacterized iron-regulated membrane protein